MDDAFDPTEAEVFAGRQRTWKDLGFDEVFVAIPILESIDIVFLLEVTPHFTGLFSKRFPEIKGSQNHVEGFNENGVVVDEIDAESRLVTAEEILPKPAVQIGGPFDDRIPNDTVLPRGQPTHQPPFLLLATELIAIQILCPRQKPCLQFDVMPAMEGKLIKIDNLSYLVAEGSSQILVREDKDSAVLDHDPVDCLFIDGLIDDLQFSDVLLVLLAEDGSSGVDQDPHCAGSEVKGGFELVGCFAEGEDG